MDKIRILVSDDHNLVRQGLINLLESDKGLIVIGEAEDGYSLIDKYKKTKPDIVISDISMPKMNGMEASKRVLSIDSNAKIIFLTIYDGDEYIYKAIKLGAFGLLTKNSLKGELLKVIKTVSRGGKYFCGKSNFEIEDIQKRYGNIVATSESFYDNLSGKEKDVLNLIAQGLTSEEIAEKLELGKRAVDYYRSEIMEKLNLKSLPQLIKYAVEYSFIKKED